LAPVLCCCFCLFSLNGGVASAEWSFPLLWLGDVEVAHLPKASASMGVILALSVAFTLLAGLMSTLTLSLMSADKMTLQRLINSDTCALRKRAERVMGVIKRRHLLVSTLFLADAVLVEALPILLYFLLGPLPALIISVIEILIFGEIVPQALASRYGLLIAGSFTWFVWILIVVLFPIAWPVSQLLGWALGGSGTTYFRRADLAELVNLHVRESQANDVIASTEEGQEEEGRESSSEGLTRNEANIIQGVLGMKVKSVGSCMTPLDEVFMIPLEARLTEKVMDEILESGYSRVPVYHKSRNDIMGMLLVKSLLKVSPQDAVPVEELFLHRLPTVAADMPLYPMLALFQRGHSHMAVVVDAEDRVTVLGVITLEDVIEEVIQEEITDETDDRNLIDSIRAQGVRLRLEKKSPLNPEVRRLERAVSSVVLRSAAGRSPHNAATPASSTPEEPGAGSGQLTPLLNYPSPARRRAFPQSATEEV